MATHRSPTNETTHQILTFIFNEGFFGWRQNSLPIPVVRGGVFSGYRPGSMVGAPDVFFLYPYHEVGVLCGVEVKTGRDRLRPEQIGFHRNMTAAGSPVFVVKDGEDFVRQFTAWRSEHR